MPSKSFKISSSIMGLMLATAGAAQQPARTIQQDFEAAAALSDKRDYAEALLAWEALEKRTATNRRSRAIVELRKAAALVGLGRNDDALVAVRAGLASLPKNDATLAEDRTIGLMILGNIATDTLDYAGAAAALAEAEADAPNAAEKMGAMLALIQVQTFVDSAAAAATVARAEALVASVKTDKWVAAQLARRITVLKLNSGDIRGARDSAMRAVRLLGGLTERTDTSDVAARSDAAIALLLEGNPDEARRYMAYTGAGRLDKGSFDPASEMRSPYCGGEAGLKPQDVAVVEFSIAADGSVADSTPIYAAGGGRVALEFARAVRGWSWPVEKVAAIPQFFRLKARVEMRCSTAFARPSIGDGLDGELEQWLVAKGVVIPPQPEGSQAAALAIQRAALAQAEAQSPTSLRTLAAIYRMTTNSVLPREERAALYARALPIAVQNGAPPLVRLALDLPGRTSMVADASRGQFVERTVSPLLSDPGYAGDPQARSAIRLLLADSGSTGSRASSKNADALALLRQVADDGALKPNDPLKVGALIRIASIEQRDGQLDAARKAFEATGLTANQCAIMDAPPKAVSMPGSEAFPLEAMRWGFEGWSQVQYDIGADGRVVNERALLSYPPFIFSQASAKFFGDSKYAKTYRPDGGLGCGATTQRIVFRLPNKGGK